MKDRFTPVSFLHLSSLLCMQISRSGFQVEMTQQLLDAEQISTGF